MAHLTKIGNSQGLRIPKPIIEQANLAGIELSFKVVNEGLLITPNKKPREGWNMQIQQTLEKHGKEVLDNEWLDTDLTLNKDWQW